MLHILLHPELRLDPGVNSGWVKGPIDEGGRVDVGLRHGLEHGGDELQHVVPLTSANPVAIVSSIKSVKATLGVKNQG